MPFMLLWLEVSFHGSSEGQHPGLAASVPSNESNETCFEVSLGAYKGRWTELRRVYKDGWLSPWINADASILHSSEIAFGFNFMGFLDSSSWIISSYMVHIGITFVEVELGFMDCAMLSLSQISSPEYFLVKNDSSLTYKQLLGNCLL